MADDGGGGDVVVGRAVVVSDLHLQSAATATAQRFLEFVALRVAPDPACTLIVAGDLVDFWYAMPAGPPAEIAPLVDALDALPGRTIWLEGNHDLRLARGLGGHPGIETRPAGVALRRAGGERIWVEHGDLVRRGGRWTRRLLTSPLAEAGARVLGSDGTFALGNFVGRKRKPEGGYAGQSRTWLRLARGFARARRAEGFAWTALGHGHWLGEWPEDGLICLGDWLQFSSYLELAADGSPPALRTFDAQASVDPPSSGRPAK